MTDKNVGLIGKYIVERTDGKPVNWCFVLEDKDPLAWSALLVYADMAESAGKLQLATELRAKVKEIGIGPGPLERTWDDGATPTRDPATIYTSEDLAEIRADIEERRSPAAGAGKP